MILSESCARNAGVLLHYEGANGSAISARVRLLELQPDRIVVDRPRYKAGQTPIPLEQTVVVAFQFEGARYEFKSRVVAEGLKIALNGQLELPAIAIARPHRIMPGNRRSDYRVTLGLLDEMEVMAAECHPTRRDACLLNATRFAGSLCDISAGGLSLRITSRPVPSQVEGHWFLSFELVGENSHLHALGAVRRCQRNPAGELVVAFEYIEWPGADLAIQRRVLARFVAAQERRMLQRKRR